MGRFIFVGLCVFCAGNGHRVRHALGSSQAGRSGLSQLTQPAKSAAAAQHSKTLRLPNALRALADLLSWSRLASAFNIPNQISASHAVNVLLDDTLQRSRMAERSPRMGFMDALSGMMPKGDSYEFSDRAPKWDALKKTLEAASTEEELRFREELESGRSPRANAMATKRLFDLPDGEKPRVTFYRDTAAWCPYCEKVWIMLEEKRVPYTVDKVNMNCYGSKPDWFWAMQPSGGIPVAKIDGDVIRESNDIMFAIEEAFPERTMMPANPRIKPLLRLERELFGSWFRGLGMPGGMGMGMVDNFEQVLAKVDSELAVEGGPYFLGKEISIVDCMFAPFLERMAASFPYYKGLEIRRNPDYPRVEEWFLAMESRDSYRNIQSDFYTHVKDLPPQVGPCASLEGSEEFRDSIDGRDGSWRLPLPEDDPDLPQPVAGLGQSADAARREAAERLIANYVDVGRFAARGLASLPGMPPVSASLSDPNCVGPEESLPLVDTLLRSTAQSLLEGPDVMRAQLSEGISGSAAERSLGYLRDRISVPRDMSYPAARQLRAHLNEVIDAVSKNQLEAV